MGRLFRAEDLAYPGTWLTDDPEDPVNLTDDISQAAVIDETSDWGRYLVSHPDECAIKIHYLPEDQQMRHQNQPQLPL